MELTIINNSPRFMNKSLEKATNLILAIGTNIRTKQYDIAAILADVETNKLYTDDGFSSTAEYANSVFGMEKSLAYALITIGKEYTRPLLSEKGKITGHCSNLLPPADSDKNDAPINDFTTGQISRFMSLGRDKVVSLINDGILKPSLTIREINAIVKAQKLIIVDEPDEAISEDTAPAETELVNSLSEYSVNDLVKELEKRGYIVSITRSDNFE